MSLSELARRHRGLCAAGALNFLAALVVAGSMPFDTLEVGGVDRWLKPLKFGLSVGLYLWTLAWLLPGVTSHARVAGRIGWGVALILVLENACIFLQAARGTSSHYNTSTPFDGAVFATMGILIALNSALVLGLLVASFTGPPAARRPWTWGVRAGLVLFLAGSAQGVVMIAGGAHTVGAQDGGPGLPLVDWSTRAGDLRAAHMLALHGLQLMPLVGHLCARRADWSEARGTRVVLVVFVLVLLASLALHLVASAGVPLLRV